MHWRSIGPALSGGRVAAVAGTDADPLLYYFGAAGGGVYRTRNGGATWDDVFAKMPVASIGALAIAPSDKNIVWVGTGESKPRNDITLGDGVWKSLDGGKTWLHVGVDSPSIARILIDRRNPNIVLIGALGDPYKDSRERGVYRTSDGGKTWQQTLYVGPESGASDLAWDARSSNLVFAGIWQIHRVPWNFTSGGTDDGLYRSRDGGVTWTRLHGNGLPAGIMGRIGVAVAPSNPRIVYALIQSSEGALWRSTDGGDHWHLMTRDSYINQRPFYMSRLDVDPQNPNHVFFSSEDLVESRDGGRTIHTVDAQTHQDHHGMWIAADGKRMIEANDGGAPISLDGGTTWDWRLNVSIAQIYRLGYDMSTPYNVCGGIQDNDSYCGPSDSLNPLGILNHDWRDVGNDSDGSWVWPDPHDSNLVWVVGVRDLNGQLTVYDKRSRQSHDVTPYVRDTNGEPLAGLPYRFNWEAPLAFSHFDSRLAYFGGNVVWLTNDVGRHWRQISPDLTRNEPAHQQVAGGPINTDVSGAEFYDTILDIAPSGVDRNVIWVGTDDGLVQLTRDEGANWKNVTMTSVPAYGRVESIEASPHNAGSAFAVLDCRVSGDQSPYIYATSDYGASWRPVMGDLPSDEIIHVVRQDPRNADVLYAGGEHGVWVSLTGGMHWQTLSNNMPTVSVHDLRIHPRDNDLIAATHGRGFWILDDLTPLQASASSVTSQTAFFQPRDAFTFFRWWSHEYGYGGSAGPTCCPPQNQFSGENPASGVFLSYYLPQSAKRAPTMTISDASGRIIAHQDASNNAGINRVAWDLTEEPPVPWHSQRSWNQGPSGLTVIPGTYSATLSVDGQSFTRTLTVKPDPRAHWTQADYLERHAFLAGLYAEVDQIDAALNRLDAVRGMLARKIDTLESRHAPAAQVQAAKRFAHQAQIIYAELTSNPRNSEDPLWRADKLRERILILIDVYDLLSQGPPSQAHKREAAEIRPLYETTMSHYQHFISSLGGG
jgi:photosystem II stability/assembly factor-like uncharacterized protein